MEVEQVRAIFGSFSRRRQSGEARAPKRQQGSAEAASPSPTAASPVAPAPAPAPAPADALASAAAAAVVAVAVVAAPADADADAPAPDAPPDSPGPGPDPGQRGGDGAGPAGPLGTTCPLCGRLLADPRVLPCLHSFCAACLEQLASLDSHAPRADGSPSAGGERQGAHSRSNSGSGYDSGGGAGAGGGRLLLQCPACGHVSRLPAGGVGSLPPNYLAQHRIVLASLNKATTRLLCDVCPGERPAGWRCSECLLNLCDGCRGAHDADGAVAGGRHEVLSLAEARRRGITRVRRQLMCPQHGQHELRLFCGACARLACAECLQGAAGAHRGHSVQPVARAAAPRARALKDALERARPAAERGAAALAALQQVAARVQARCSQVQAEVDRFAEAYAAALEQHRRALRRQARDAADAKLAAVRAQARRLERVAGDASAAVAFADDLLTEASDAEVLSLAAPVLRRLQGVAAPADGAKLQQLLEAPRVSEELAFMPGEGAGLVGGFPLVGVVSTQAACPARCTLLAAAALLDCRVHKRTEVVLQTRDNDGEPLCHGGEKIAAELRHRDASSRKVPVHVADQRDGTYLLTFIPETPGRLALSVTLHNTPIQGSPFPVLVRIQKAHQGQYHCCCFCSSGGNKETTCGCGATMPGGYMGCGHGHLGHPGRRHWSCCGNVLENSECTTRGRSNSAVYQFTL
ncbi:hypothetical protein R5R35_010196 [Gryllus longicercus]|uniref:B box-type domain-containing protein n=1 Tax=Gryllus longicercus TaxID=2509291 RepID=A0AAN9VTW8_9ORTH